MSSSPNVSFSFKKAIVIVFLGCIILEFGILFTSLYTFLHIFTYPLLIKYTYFFNYPSLYISDPKENVFFSSKYDNLCFIDFGINSVNKHP